MRGRKQLSSCPPTGRRSCSWVLSGRRRCSCAASWQLDGCSPPSWRQLAASQAREAALLDESKADLAEREALQLGGAAAAAEEEAHQLAPAPVSAAGRLASWSRRWLLRRQQQAAGSISLLPHFCLIVLVCLEARNVGVP